jgi:hypothetical protein
MSPLDTRDDGNEDANTVAKDLRLHLTRCSSAKAPLHWMDDANRPLVSSIGAWQGA